jgi:hypothetical protein
MSTDEPAPELSEEELDALIAQAGLELSPTERGNVLTTARFLRQAAALVRAANATAEGLAS